MELILSVITVATTLRESIRKKERRCQYLIALFGVIGKRDSENLSVNSKHSRSV